MGTTGQFFQSLGLRTGIVVLVKVGMAITVGSAVGDTKFIVGVERNASFVGATKVAGVFICPVEHAERKIIKKKIFCFMSLFADRSNGFGDLLGEHGFTCRSEMDGAVGKFLGGDEIP